MTPADAAKLLAAERVGPLRPAGDLGERYLLLLAALASQEAELTRLERAGICAEWVGELRVEHARVHAAVCAALMGGTTATRQ